MSVSLGICQFRQETRELRKVKTNFRFLTGGHVHADAKILEAEPQKTGPSVKRTRTLSRNLIGVRDGSGYSEKAVCFTWENASNFVRNGDGNKTDP